MPKSPFFSRIKGDVLKIVSSIPLGKISTFHSIGAHLDVVPRHVAYILSTLEPLEKIQYPWYRVVGDKGDLGKLKRSELGEPQSELLRAEGILVSKNSVGDRFAAVFIAADQLNSGIKKQSRPANAPLTKIKKTKP
jgi:methylated-DNA-protein-cysteine methyltransferase related protein